MYGILLFLLIQKVLFAQSLEKSRSFQVDKILSSTIGKNEFVVSVSLTYSSGGQHIYIIKQTKDSLLVTEYGKTVDNKIEGVVSISANDDTSFVKKVSMLYDDIKQNHSYQSYSKEILSDGYFFLTYYEENKLQIFNNKGASKNQLAMIDDIFYRLEGLSITPFGGVNPRRKYLKIENWDELLKYLKSGSMYNISK
jgi:hypothetical protein